MEADVSAENVECRLGIEAYAAFCRRKYRRWPDGVDAGEGPFRYTWLGAVPRAMKAGQFTIEDSQVGRRGFVGVGEVGAEVPAAQNDDGRSFEGDGNMCRARIVGYYQRCSL